LGNHTQIEGRSIHSPRSRPGNWDVKI
jgi:hypothetical protein